MEWTDVRSRDSYSRLRERGTNVPHQPEIGQAPPTHNTQHGWSCLRNNSRQKSFEDGCPSSSGNKKPSLVCAAARDVGPDHVQQ